MATRFVRKWRQRNAEDAHICIGLDPRLEDVRKCVPYGTDAEAVYQFCANVVNATFPFAGAYKPQIAFFEALGDQGHAVLRRVIYHIREVAPGIPVILDAKRADIGATNDGYVNLAFEYFDADAVTVNPYFGQEALEPFLKYGDRTIVVLCRTSNPGAGEMQDIVVKPIKGLISGQVYLSYEQAFAAGESGGAVQRTIMPYYQYVAHLVANTWNGNHNCAVVVGATVPEQLAAVRKIVGPMPILLPGIGTQGGKLDEAYKNGVTDGRDILVPNNASAINFAALKLRNPETNELRFTPEQYAEAAALAAEEMNDAVAAQLAPAT